MMTGEPAPELLKLLYQKHVERYERRLLRAMAGDRGYRAPELEELLRLWRELPLKGWRFSRLSEAAQSEIQDAIEDEGADLEQLAIR